MENNQTQHLSLFHEGFVNEMGTDPSSPVHASSPILGIGSVSQFDLWKIDIHEELYLTLFSNIDITPITTLYCDSIVDRNILEESVIEGWN